MPNLQYANHELPDVQAGFRKGRGTRDQIAYICWIIKKAREFQKKKSISALLTMPKPLTVRITTNSERDAWLASRNLYAGQEATVRTGHGTTDRFQIGKGVRQGCILSPCLFHLHAGYIMKMLPGGNKLESRLLGEISITSDMQMTSPLWQKVKN